MRVGRIFYFDKREDEIFKEFLDTSNEMVRGAKYLEQSITEIRGKKHDSDVEKAIECEKVCNVNFFKITEEIIKIRRSTSRYELIRLNQALEKIAKAIEGASYRVKMSHGVKIPDYMNKGLREMTAPMVKTVSALTEALKEMPFDSEQTIDKLNDVYKFEDETDKKRRASCLEFLHSKKDLSLQKYYIWQEIVTKVESVADSCEEAAEIMKRIIAARE